MAVGDFQDETQYRSVMKKTLDRIERAFRDVDPDVAECVLQFGALSITLAGGQKCILSAQPSVQQLWMAVAARGIAFHFDYDQTTEAWKDDRGQGIDPFSLLQKLLREIAGLELRF